MRLRNCHFELNSTNYTRLKGFKNTTRHIIPKGSSKFSCTSSTSASTNTLQILHARTKKRPKRLEIVTLDGGSLYAPPLLLYSALLKVVKTARDILVESVLPFGVPSAQSRATFDKVTCSPFDAEAVKVLVRTRRAQSQRTIQQGEGGGRGTGRHTSLHSLSGQMM